jgi:hypothetical protein
MPRSNLPVLAMLVATVTWAHRSVPSAPVYRKAHQHAEVLISVFGLRSVGHMPPLCIHRLV